MSEVRDRAGIVQFARQLSLLAPRVEGGDSSARSDR